MALAIGQWIGDDFVESEHPRAQGGTEAGQFVRKGDRTNAENAEYHKGQYHSAKEDYEAALRHVEELKKRMELQYRQHRKFKKLATGGLTANMRRVVDETFRTMDFEKLGDFLAEQGAGLVHHALQHHLVIPILKRGAEYAIAGSLGVLFGHATGSGMMGIAAMAVAGEAIEFAMHKGVEKLGFKEKNTHKALQYITRNIIENARKTSYERSSGKNTPTIPETMFAARGEDKDFVYALDELNDEDETLMAAFLLAKTLEDHTTGELLQAAENARQEPGAKKNS